MIKVKNITIKEFRGIRSLTLNFDNRNFTVCGPNGTGKSGVVDALEFALTGNVSRLSGEGTGSVSLKVHGPHVDSRNRPDKAIVIITIFIPSLNKNVQIERSVSNISNPKITPNDPDVKKILEKIESHPEFVLSRRELIRYIISKPGRRSEEVQALLRLDKIDNLRKILNKISNSYRKSVEPMKREKQTASQQLSLALGIAELKPELLIKEVNKRRILLSLEPIESITTSTSLKDGLITLKADKATIVNKEQAEKDLNKFNALLKKIQDNELDSISNSLIKSLEDLKKEEEDIEKNNDYNILFEKALSLVVDNKCPVCDTDWGNGKIIDFIKEKKESIKSKKEKCNLLKDEIYKITLFLNDLKNSIITIKSYGDILKPIIDTNCLFDYIKSLDEKIKKMDNLFPFSETIDSLNKFNEIGNNIKEKIEEISLAIKKIPKPTEQDSARDFLTISQERFDLFKNISIRHKQSENKAKLTESIYNKYVEISDKLLNKLYKDVEKDFGEYYQELNKDDESGFTAKLTPSIGKLGFDVDFYGKGFFPPGAYHSEGHQDAMGLCLYLTLMKHLLKDDFQFAVLDDVFMSVDTGHRREVCNLLKEKFPNTQFIFTTHDDIWLKHMKTAGLIEQNSFILFRKWDVETGPIDWECRDVWSEIMDNLNNNNIQSASSLLRYYLEYISKEICHKLRAKVEFRGDAMFQLGDLLPSATKCLSDYIKKAKDTASSWDKQDDLKIINSYQAKLSDLVQRSNVEQWQINKSVHYNEWVNFSKEDFLPVVEIFKELINFFICEKCNGMIYVSPERGEKQSVRCSCNTINFNLQKKIK